MEQYKQLLDDSKSYLKARYDLLRLELLDKLSQIMGYLIMVIVLLLLLMGVLAYLSVALVNSLSAIMPTWTACIILAAVITIIAVVLYYNKEKIFINPFVKLLSGMLFDEPQLNETEEDDGNNAQTTESNQ